jgi:hypothetical protein
MELFRSAATPDDAVILESQDLKSYAIEQHIELAELPLHPIIRAYYIREEVVTESDETVAERLENVEAVWVVTLIYGNPYDHRPELTELGFVQTTPPISLGVRDILPIIRYARPPQGAPIAIFGDNLALLQVKPYQQENVFSVYLTWQPEAAPGVDYTVSAFLLNDAGILVAQQDSFPLHGASPTSQWGANSLNFDAHHIPIEHLPPGEYDLGIKVYTWWDGAIQPAAPCEINDCFYVVVDRVRVE